MHPFRFKCFRPTRSRLTHDCQVLYLLLVFVLLCVTPTDARAADANVIRPLAVVGTIVDAETGRTRESGEPTIAAVRSIAILRAWPTFTMTLTR